jgi:hypothetical protein
LPPPTKFDKWSDGDLINCIEAEMRRTGELFRGFSHSELDQAWILDEMTVSMSAAMQAVQTLRRRVAVVQTL